MSIHQKIANDIIEKINVGFFKVGDMIPSEHELAQNYQISRATIRKAMDILIHEGWIYSVQGKGKFVKTNYKDIYSFNYKDIYSVNTEVDHVKLLGVNIIEPTKHLIYHLHIAPEKKVITIQRLIYAKKNKLIAYDEKYFPYYIGFPLKETHITSADFMELLESKLSTFLLKRELSIQAEEVSSNISNFLGLPKGETVLCIEEKIYDEDYLPVGWGKIYFLPQYIQLEAFWQKKRL
ncbi:GntR family transcriptional regulator [Eubacterium callanderi]|uniref:GntR family transcriptional regulator n=1 Tax=Eubacterium callanderi TaxID=53442 RepID=UPI001C2CE1FD|nr:GntR family transcriptional regulator [Eubacterium callanderi]